MQSMSVQQLLQTPSATGTKGEVVTGKTGDKQSVLAGILGNTKGQKVEGESLGLQGEAGEQGEQIDFSSLLGQMQNQNGEAQKVTLQGKQIVNGATSEKNISGSIAKTTNNLDQLLNNLKGTQDQPTEQAVDENGEPVKTLKKGFFPQQKTQTENPLDFIVKNAKEKNLGSVEVPVQEEVATPRSFFVKNEMIPNKITNPAQMEKLQTEEQSVKVLSGEDFVKNKSAAVLPFMATNVEEINKTDKKNLSLLGAKIPQIQNYGKGQNILNDSMIRNTNDLAFKETKKLKNSPGDELRSPDMKVSNELSMIKESPIAALQLKASPIQENKVEIDSKVLNLSHIDAKNTNEIIKTISDYVEQNQVANKSSLDLTVKHDSLGQFKIQVTKAPNQNQVDMQITTSSSEGHKFFVKNEVDLMRNLQQAGVNLSDLRIISSMKESTPFSQSESKQFSSFQHEQNGEGKQFMSFESSSDFKEGSQKRKSLWDEYQERYGA